MESFEKIYKEHFNQVRNYIAFRIRSKVDADEIANDVFIKVFKHLGDFDPTRAKILTWIIEISKNTLRDYVRTTKTYNGKGRKEKFEIDAYEADSDGNYAFAIPDQGIKSDSLYDTNLVKNKIHSAINSLSEKEQILATELFLNDRSYDEIVKITGLKLGTVKGTINRIREKLQLKLQKEYQIAL